MGQDVPETTEEEAQGERAHLDRPCRQEIGFLPMRLSDGRRDCVVLRKDASPVTLPVRGRFASLNFLHTAFVHDPHDPAVRLRKAVAVRRHVGEGAVRKHDPAFGVHDG